MIREAGDADICKGEIPLQTPPFGHDPRTRPLGYNSDCNRARLAIRGLRHNHRQPIKNR